MGQDEMVPAPKQDMDRAYDFLAKAGAGFTEEQTSAVDLRRLRRRVDWRIVPLMFACYTLSFLDKVLLNVRLSHTAMADLITNTISESMEPSWASSPISSSRGTSSPMPARSSSWRISSPSFLPVRLHVFISDMYEAEC